MSCQYYNFNNLEILPMPREAGLPTTVSELTIHDLLVHFQIILQVGKEVPVESRHQFFLHKQFKPFSMIDLSKLYAHHHHQSFKHCLCKMGRLRHGHHNLQVET